MDNEKNDKTEEKEESGKVFLPFRNLGDIDEYIFGECRPIHSEK